MNLIHACILLALLQFPARDTEPVVTLSPPHLGISFGNGGYLVRLLHETGTVSLPVAPPGKLPSGVPWYVDVENLGPEDVILQGGQDLSIHLHPKDSVRVVSNSQRYSVRR
jgi:hypothetical protein